MIRMCDMPISSRAGRFDDLPMVARADRCKRATTGERGLATEPLNLDKAFVICGPHHHPPNFRIGLGWSQSLFNAFSRFAGHKSEPAAFGHSSTSKKINAEQGPGFVCLPRLCDV